MRLLGSLLLIFAVVAVIPSGRARAEIVQGASGHITITARVLPVHYILVDASGAIIRIASNTSEDGTPKAYVNIISKNTEIQITPELYRAYRTILPVGQSHIGILYDRQVPISSLLYIPNADSLQIGLVGKTSPVLAFQSMTIL